VNPVFKFENVSKIYRVRSGLFSKGAGFAALDSINFSLERGKTYGLAGESGSGKSTLAGLLTGMTHETSGKLLFEGEPLRQVLRKGRASYAAKVQMIFQNPYLSLDPAWSVEKIVGEGILSRPSMEKKERVRSAVKAVGLSEDYLRRKPRALSGGERQRVAIARSLAVRPEFLILDEPTSQLDVSVQAQILALLKSLRPQIPAGMLFISHDFALISELADEVLVLDKGRLAEAGPAIDVLRNPQAECTRRLLEAVPFWPPREGKA